VRGQLGGVVAPYGGAVGDPVDRRVQGRVHPSVFKAQLDQLVEVAGPGGPDGDGLFLPVAPTRSSCPVMSGTLCRWVLSSRTALPPQERAG
jgi:hypothetical protein